MKVVEMTENRFRFATRVALHIVSNSKHTDVVLVQGYGLAALAANAASWLIRRPSTMLVCSPTEAYYECRRAAGLDGYRFSRVGLTMLRIIARVNARLGCQYAVLSRHLARVVLSHGARVPIHVIPVYGVDTAVFRPSTVPRAAIRQRLGLPMSGHIVFFSSRVAPEKDVDTILEAIQILKQKGSFVWLFNRSGGYRKLQAMAEAYGIADRLIATDAVHPTVELPLSYQAADVCVQASRQEGLGFSPLEALACGTPVIVSRVGGLTEFVLDGETGWTFHPGDAQELTSRIEEVIDNPQEGLRRALAGRELVRERYERRKAFQQLAVALQS